MPVHVADRQAAMLLAMLGVAPHMLHLCADLMPLMVSTRGVSRSPKILYLRKCLNPIWTSLGDPIFY